MSVPDVGEITRQIIPMEGPPNGRLLGALIAVAREAVYLDLAVSACLRDPENVASLARMQMAHERAAQALVQLREEVACG